MSKWIPIYTISNVPTRNLVIFNFIQLNMQLHLDKLGPGQFEKFSGNKFRYFCIYLNVEI